MIKEFCDRCGKEITGKLRHQINTNYIAPNGNMSYGVLSDEDKCSERTICPSCYNDFKEFMKSIK